VFNGWSANYELTLCHKHNDDQRECAKAHASKSLFGWVEKAAGNLNEEE
jgi:hypothetical protein